jgi:GT2 family glycosyltransferase
VIAVNESSDSHTPSPPSISGNSDRRLLTVLINWHEQAQTISCLRNLRAQAVPGMELLVVDNEGTMETQAAFEREQDLFDRYHRFEDNVGFTGSCNFALDQAQELGFRYILWFNNDAEPGPNCIARMLDVIESDSTIAMVNPVLQDRETGHAHFCGARLDRSAPVMRYLSLEALREAGPNIDCYLYGTALMARTDAAKRVGGFRSKSFISWEDMELSDKLLKAGYHCRMVPDARVVHTNQHSDESETVRSKYYYYYMTRNEIDFWWKALSGINRARALYWHWRRTLRRIGEFKRGGHGTEAAALRHGLLDGILGRYGRWRLHPAKK